LSSESSAVSGGGGIALVAVVALAAVTAFGYLLKHQLVDLSTQMTKYSESMRKKVSALRGPRAADWLDCPRVSTGLPNSWTSA